NFDAVFRTYTDRAAAVVPEPASWALMIAGFGLTGAMLRRRAGRRAEA
ncbi:MAG: PEPxxWA-CTERM sorting domain-containing protein, partial [Sandaracinobacteroides sp.]